MKILLCAATVFEAGACQKAIQRAGASTSASVLKTGMGGERAALVLTRALESAIASGARPARVISTGFAGSRRQDLKIGDVITARKVSFEGRSIEIDLAEIEPRASFCEVALQQVSEVMGAKNQAEAEAIDMESYSLAGVAARFQIPFSVIRMISDDPEHPIPEGGWLAIVRSPLSLAKFLARSSGLPLKLANFWERLLKQGFSG